MVKNIKILFTVLFLAGCFFVPSFAFAHQPRLVYLQPSLVNINSPELSQAFFDELKGAPRDYFITSDKDFKLYINLLVPELANLNGRYSANVYLMSGENEDKIATLDGASSDWSPFFEDYGRDYYLKGPELTRDVLAGKYKIEVF